MNPQKEKKMHEIRDPAIRLFGQKIPFPEDVVVDKEEKEIESGEEREQEMEKYEDQGHKVRLVL